VKPLVVASLLLAACAAETEAPAWNEDLGTPENPIPQTESYALVSRVKLQLAAPEVTQVIAAVRALAENPARAVLARPGGTQLLATIPAAVRGNVEGYLNTELDKIKIGSKTLRAYTADVARFTQEVLAEVVIDSSLSITPEGAVHSLVDLSFSPADVPVTVTIGGSSTDSLVQRPKAEVAVGGALALGEQKFGLGFGTHAWQAINLASETIYGKDLSIFTSAVNCTTIAQAVAARCVSGTCVGHATEIAQFCTSALTGMVADAGTQLSAVKMTSFKLSGSAKLVDDNGDGIADRITNGTWNPQLDVGSATATFGTE
jgi:hypothetical protein